ncbi:MAG: HAD family hydrolase [Oscillospiraceae bacterium]|nr:HAD family hydrolase [Oscillospiraceae bacterium]
MKYKGIIFDLDGTVADTGEDLSTAMNLMLESFGFEKKSREETLKYINMGAREFVKGCLPDEVKNLPNYQDFLEEAFKRYFGFYEEHCLENTHLYGGIAGLVKSLYEKNIKMCVLSNKQDNMTKKIVTSLLNQEYFTEILGFTDGRFPHKPKPDSALYLADRMGVTPDKTVFIGDSNIDMNTAQNAGMFPLGVTWGYRPESVLIEAGAKKIAYNPSEILDFILNIK